jgi:alanyl-tRNA synthetase
MKGSEIRKKFLDYFAGHGHEIVKSSGLIPKNDPTLLFANAGMNQFKDTFLGIEKRPYKRACSSQKCVRAGGKHNDLENVGYTARHHTFFEMLGNFSFGDYFKKDAIFFGWDFLTREMGLPKDKLWVTVYKDDDEAFRLWQEVAGVSAERIVRLGEKDNFWAMGDEGPCGPCSEILIDQGESIGCKTPDCKVGCDCDRYLELWNLVFMQFNRKKDGTMDPLPNPSIDTGMGLERVSAVLQGVKTNYETDLLFPYIKKLSGFAGIEYGRDNKKDVHLRVIADHIRAITFLVSDGIFPSNEGRGYVLRRIMRRAIRHAKMLGFSKPVLFELAPVVVEVMRDSYPELAETVELVRKVILNEEERFFETLEAGLKLLSERMDELKVKGGRIMPGEAAFKLYDTFGFPIDLTQDILRENSIELDIKGFEEHMEAQREMARKSWKGEEEAIGELYKRLAQEVKIEFVGYDTIDSDARLLKIIASGAEVGELGEGCEGEFIFDRTPFYGESGGQAGDKGEIIGTGFRIVVEDTKKVGELIIHKGKVGKGFVKKGDTAGLMVKHDLRENTASHHTATHLLQAALQKVLGGHVKQAGSLVESERFRFDFTHFSAIKRDELKKIEEMVNKWIRQNKKVIISVMAYDEAVKKGAMAIFGEKYGDVVRMVEVDSVSRELCGGTHQTDTGRIGLFKILSEESVASGVRRIEGVAGEAALRWIQETVEKIEKAAELLKASPRDLETRIEKILKRERELERELESALGKLSSYQAKEGMDKKDIGNGIFAIATKVSAGDVNQLRTIMDMIKDREKNAVIFVSSEIDSKGAFLLHVPDSLISQYDAGKLLQEVVKGINGRGGGKKTLAQGGCPDAQDIKKAVEIFFKAAGHDLDQR